MLKFERFKINAIGFLVYSYVPKSKLLSQNYECLSNSDHTQYTFRCINTTIKNELLNVEIVFFFLKALKKIATLARAFI